MGIRAFLIISGLLSLVYFLAPEKFEFLNTKENDVLGIQKINAQVNKSPIETSLLMYCLDKKKLPNNLNTLYGDYLSEKIKLDLNKLFNYKVVNGPNCEYQLDLK
jgi:hypothetical protein